MGVDFIIELKGLGKFYRDYGKEQDSEYLALKSIVIKWKCSLLNLDMFLIKKGHNVGFQMMNGSSFVTELNNYQLDKLQEVMKNYKASFEFGTPKQFMEWFYEKYYLQ